MIIFKLYGASEPENSREYARNALRNAAAF